MESLLDEMVSVEDMSRFPDPYYESRQESSYNRHSVTPGTPGWFMTDDFDAMRIDTMGARIERVMFDETGPGVITRIWITTLDKRGTWRFYFDGAAEPGWIVDGYDLMKIGIPGLGRGLLQPHTGYSPVESGKGGNTLFLPIPYAEGCKITFEDGPGVKPTPKYYGINYRKYPPKTKIETFSPEVLKRAEKKIIEVDSLLLNPPPAKTGTILSESKTLAASESLEITLPKGENAVYEIKFNVGVKDTAVFMQLMRSLIFCAEFDDKQTVWVPLGDFSGGGMGAPYVKSWYLDTDGKGNITSRWLMPYKEEGMLKLVNISAAPADVKMEVNVSPLKWNGKSLYFHSSWRQERQIPVHKYDEPENCADWNFATMEGRGVFKGDVLSLFNHAERWYGEGDEKIWVDDDTFPSHFGTGTEDYYNSSWAPVFVFHTPFGGAPRADLDSSHGYNTFFRTRNLDGIPFRHKFVFDIEMIGWQRGFSDYSTTTYWYGDTDTRAVGTSGVEEAGVELLPAPPDPKDHKIAGSIEFETLTPVAKSPSLRVEKQNMAGFPGGKWSRAEHLLGRSEAIGNYIEFEFDNLEASRYQMTAYTTLARNYGIISFAVNGKTAKVFDGYSIEVRNSGPVNIGTFTPKDGKITLRVETKGSNRSSQGEKYYFGLDCIQLTPEGR